MSDSPVFPPRRLCRLASALAAATLLALVGCASGPGPSKRPASAPGADGPGDNVPPGLANLPDAEPRVEPLARAANRPYSVAGRDYVPVVEDRPYRERGIASWYGRKFHGRRTSSGEVYDMYAMSAAHPTLPIPSYARVRHVASGREVVVRINDRGPFHSKRIIDVSYAAALKLGFLKRGSAEVEVERLTHGEIRAGTWRREAPPDATTVARSEPVAADPPAPPPAEPPAAAPPVAPAAAPAPQAAAVVENATPAPVVASATTTGPGPGEAAPTGFWVQLGVFRQRSGAESFHRRVSGELDWLKPVLGIFEDTALFRLQAGPYPTRAEAASTALRLQDALKLVPMVVERR
ncbi:septal ring lytic transglycosylase RlpA family protein [Eleftheria terrae]|uniref:septal ring lytic transglycosylase RlpA family protein n=1 Tax=Eleftheria terrae TaxID=1597781 RepID=UPI00263BE01E|nr:septal ring lytic transglycosylase RlpA family protein [Eleftheria terrae]WKB51363.1 septal ring lytic transglycosylase RlpA family protein [Eleftheria terrae]